MSTVVERIRRVMKSKKISIRELGRLSNIPQASINRYLSMTENFDGEERVKIPTEKLQSIADALGVTPGYLMGWDQETIIPPSLSHILFPVTKKSIPILGNVACGEPLLADERYEDFIQVNSSLDVDFCLTAKGDSMVNARIFEGDVLFVKKQSIVENGEIAVVLIGEEATVKRVYIDYDENTREISLLTLVPENPIYKPKRFMGAELQDIRILGKVVSGQYVIS